MDRFNWEARLEKIYAAFPEAETKPVIGITANFSDGQCLLAEGYYKAVAEAGGVPVLIPPVDDTTAIINTLQRIDGLLLSGGGDFNPLYCGEEPVTGLHSINSERDLPELLTARLAYQRQIPTLGICRGIQTLAMALGGKVCQDITPQATVKHSQDAHRSEPTHTVSIVANSVLHGLYGTERMAVNSFHHQAVASTGSLFRATATAADGTIEAMESTCHKVVMGVQWHPECMAEGRPLFGWLVDRAAEFAKAKRLHTRILTLDTHCDTPMLFPKGADISRRDPGTLVDLHKMADGRQDAAIMVAYLPQPAPGQTFAEKVKEDGITPAAYADRIFSKIEGMAEANSRYLRTARSPEQLYINKQCGRHSIMLGIENALALEGRPDMVGHFAKRGVVYITLCHNGDNDICDSAKGCATHGGVSPLGAEVIAEMNRWGVMVDMSHASEKSFFDALSISTAPIVCSHSSARALCDHPRNLTDSQMRALAAAGGVAQTTLYHGFLRSDGQASVTDAIAHMEHAISVMGIDHVGIGTDFDGDGGVCGYADASETINFTRMLLARRYSADDIEKIMGGNFIRVMQAVQQSRTAM